MQVHVIYPAIKGEAVKSLSVDLFQNGEPVEATRKSFSVPLSASGSFPATHYGGSAWLSDEEVERWHDVDGVDYWMLDNQGRLVLSTRDAGKSPSFLNAVQTLGLQLIERTDI